MPEHISEPVPAGVGPRARQSPSGNMCADGAPWRISERMPALKVLPFLALVYRSLSSFIFLLRGSAPVLVLALLRRIRVFFSGRRIKFRSRELDSGQVLTVGTSSAKAQRDRDGHVVVEQLCKSEVSVLGLASPVPHLRMFFLELSHRSTAQLLESLLNLRLSDTGWQLFFH